MKADMELPVRNTNALFEPFDAQNHRFTKTGSGQTYEKLRKRVAWFVQDMLFMYLDSLFLVLSAGKSWLGIDRTDGMRYPKELHTLTTKRNRPFFFLSCARVRRALLRLLDAVPHDCAGPSLYTLPKGPEAIPRHVAGGAGNACFEPIVC